MRDDAQEAMYVHPEGWPVDLRIATIVALCVSSVAVAAFFFVKLVGI